MSRDGSKISKTLGLDGPEDGSVGWWGHASSKTRVIALTAVTIVGAATFLLFNWMMQDQAISFSLGATIIATLTALNLLQAWERSTVQEGKLCK